ncbi:MAG: 3-deoxy-7-phosphoheptulonate synthase [Bacteroidales bacterium]|nr:3-deoxy-7-phosphoheptulonate synthase [Bacteroidales bacterium]
MIFKRRLPIPKELKEMYPVSQEGARAKLNNDAEIRRIITGGSDRMLLVIGPCSADREDAVLEYIGRLSALRDKVAEKIMVVPRIFTGKPRSAGAGYKGMLHQPDPLGESDVLKGLIALRRLHMRVLNETGLSCADELLYPEEHRFLSDLLSYVSVGARSVEDQQHRLTASGLDIPVGMKNPLSGDLTAMLNAVGAAQSGHTFIYRNWEVESKGNPLAHAILRGYKDRDGQHHPNCGRNNLLQLAGLYAGSGLQNPALIVDCNHSNSGKDCFRQGVIAKDVLKSAAENSDIKRLLKGFMIESYLEDGCQQPGGSIYGQSITDPCLGWEKTERLILELADLW